VIPPCNAEDIVYDKSSVSEIAVVSLRVEPKYPMNAYRNKIYKGYALSNLTIGKSGKVKKVELVEFSKGGFDKAAKVALKKWKYKPALLNGEAVNSLLTVRLDWEVDGK
jgi:protein TonB